MSSKKKLLVSVSGGETSMFMAQWLWRHKQEEYDMIFVYANTGEENEETLSFINSCSIHFKIPIVWVEAFVHHNNRKATGHDITSYHKASRNGEPFEEVIKKYGIPNQAMMHCTRELKENPIRSYAKSIGWKDYYTAIGIRTDEMGRQNRNAATMKIIYPLISMIKTTKPMINFYWSNMPFRLDLKGYEGNCKTCWKKSDNKLYTIAKENERKFLFFGKMEARYGNYIPESRLKLIAERGEYPIYPVRFFRGQRSVEDIVNASKSFTGIVKDDSLPFPMPDLFSDDTNENESCEVFSSCSET